MSNCTNAVPSSKELFAYIANDPPSIVLLTFMSLFTVVIVAMYSEAVVYIERKVQDSRTRVRLKIILGIYPVYAGTSLLALFVPRAHLITSLTANIFFSTGLFQFMMLIISYFGGREQLLSKLEGHTIKLAIPPLLCCCVCLPTAPVNQKNLIRLRRLVMQTAFLRPMCNLISLILWADGYPAAGASSAQNPFMWLNVISLCSSISAIYGVLLLMKLSEEHLSDYRVKPKFLLVQLVLLITVVQSVIVGALALGGLIPCDALFPISARGDYYLDCLVIVEMFLLSFFARFFFRRRIRQTPAGRDHPDHQFNSIVKRQPENEKEKEAKKDRRPANGSRIEKTGQNGDAKLTGYMSYNNNDGTHINVSYESGV